MENLDISLNLGVALLGAITAELFKHEGENLALAGLKRMVITKSIPGLFAGLMAWLFAKYMKWDMYLTTILCGCAGYTSKEFLEYLKEKMKGKIDA